MRKGPAAEFDDEMGGNFDFTVDWKENPHDVMAAADRILKQHGLEVVTHESDGDFYAFSIQPIAKKR